MLLYWLSTVHFIDLLFDERALSLPEEDIDCQPHYKNLLFMKIAIYKNCHS